MSQPSLAGRRILLGVSGGIAAYKSAELVRGLRAAGSDVQVVLTDGGARFITPVTLQALSGHPVRQSLWDENAEAAMGHIELARWPDAVVVAPASANVMSRLAAGMTTDLLSTLCLASDRPLLLAPAMNRLMWAHPATQANLATLKQRGATVVGPDAGDQACGEVGEGRMSEPTAIIQAIGQLLGAGSGPLAGRHAVITAGPTREAVDPVRVLTNRSSGRMGFAVASALARTGAEVTLVAGPVTLETPPGVTRVDVESAADMAEAASRHATGADLFVGCAAVADYRPADTRAQKIKKHDESLSLALARTEDILTRLRAEQPGLFMVGFAAETENLAANARDKLERKGLQMVAGNLVGDGRAFDREDNTLTIFTREGAEELGCASKAELASALVERIAQNFNAFSPSTSSDPG